MSSKYRVLVPKTKFPLRTNPLLSDNSIREAAKFDQLYEWQLENREPSKTFVLHDGPPYANGAPHMGHALNKTLKDIINRYKLLRGHRVLYRPGWDCHGLPIELKACKDGGECGVALSATEIRTKAAQFAQSAINDQKQAFKSWGCLGDWDNPYLTMDKRYEADQLGVFYEMYKKGCIYRGFKPVYWSPSTKTALAEAELEYRDHVSRSVHVLFPITTKSFSCAGDLEIDDVSALVWTTTPWTLVANRAICYHPAHWYSLVRIKDGEFQNKVVLVGTKSLDRLGNIIGDYESLGTIPGSQLEGTCYMNPINQELTAPCPFLPADHVSDEEGTGLVHTAPAHGYDDYCVGLKHNLSLSCLVNEEGRYTREAGEQLEGRFVLDNGNQCILESLRETGALVREAPYTHRYPYDWRSKMPVIIRATEQWFASVKSLKEKATSAVINEVTMYPPSSKKRLLPMLDGREDWCISRQRVWGVPLPVFYHRHTGEPLIMEEIISHVRDLVLKHGTDCWWDLPVVQLLPPSLQPTAKDYKKGEDTMDVWFDSGSSWAAVLKDSGCIADMYLEGSDQHRGWFQSSLLTSVAVQTRAPYQVVVTHGFVLDKTGDKMSKSVGNVILPEGIIRGKKLGADVMRLWVATSDYTQDVQLSDLVLEQNRELLQKLRNTCRFMLGNLADFNPRSDSLPYDRLLKLDCYILHLLREYDQTALRAYESLNFSSLFQTLVNFLPTQLSSFYFDIIKDRMYCNSAASMTRKSSQTALYHILRTLVRSVAPVVPHLAEEVSHHHPMKGLCKRHHCQ